MALRVIWTCALTAVVFGGSGHWPLAHSVGKWAKGEGTAVEPEREVEEESKPTEAQKVVKRLLGGAGKSWWGKTVWPDRGVAQRLPEVLRDEDLSDECLIGAFGLLKSECAMADAIKKHGMQAIWAADRRNAVDVMEFGSYLFGLGRLELLSWLVEQGDLNYWDRLPSGKSVMCEALWQDGEFLVWMAQRGARLDKLEEELGESLYVAVSKHCHWGRVAEKICALGLEAGLDPWKKPDGGDWPFLEALANEEGVGLWILDRDPGFEMGQMMLGELLGAAKALKCSAAQRKLRAMAEAREVGEGVDMEQRRSAKALEEFGRLALSLAQAGRISVDGVRAQSPGELARIAAQNNGEDAKPSAPPRRI